MPEAECRQIAGADHDVGLELVDLADGALEKAGLEVRPAAVHVRDLGDAEDLGAGCHGQSLRGRGGALAGRVRPGRDTERARAPSEVVATLAWVQVESTGFQAYCGLEPPRFANRTELECAKILDYYGVRWDYEPQTFVLERDEDGRVVSAFTPDFYLPEQELFIEVTVMKQSLVTRKNRKLREVRRLYPHVRVKLFYRRDIERLAQRYRLRWAS